MEAKGLLKSQAEWLNQTVRAARNRREIQFVIRAHPNTSGKRALGINANEVALFEQISSEASDNLIVVQPDADISSFDLIAVSTAGLVWHSSLGLEMAAMGKPVLRAGAYWFRDASFMATPRSDDDYENAIDRILVPISEAGRLDRTVQAWRFAACWFLRQSMAFPLVKQSDWAHGELAFETFDALAPGCDRSLDRICSVIMDGAPIHPLPEQRSAATAEAEQEAVAAYIEHFAKS